MIYIGQELRQSSAGQIYFYWPWMMQLLAGTPWAGGWAGLEGSGWLPLGTPGLWWGGQKTEFSRDCLLGWLQMTSPGWGLRVVTLLMWCLAMWKLHELRIWPWKSHRISSALLCWLKQLQSSLLFQRRGQKPCLSQREDCQRIYSHFNKPQCPTWTNSKEAFCQFSVLNVLFFFLLFSLHP